VITDRKVRFAVKVTLRTGYDREIKHLESKKSFEGSVALLPKQLNTQLSNPLNAS